jgi:uncharacterized protein YbaA (DUF1428 family)
MTYVDGFVIPVPFEKKEAYRKMAADAAVIFKEYGMLHVVECWGDDVPDGKLTDFRRAVAAQKKMIEDPRMQPPEDMPFDGKRMIYGGFVPILDSRED